MPIRRIPVVHKFGIISYSQRLELQERLSRKVLEENTFKSECADAIDRSLPYEIDEDFPEKFNSAESDEKDEIEEKARNILLRAKRKAGLRDGGIGGHVNLQQAWKDLSLLALCESRSIQEGSLEALCQSLDKAPISRTHVISLFVIAKQCVAWLGSKAMNQPYLRTGELKIVKIAHFVFLRLYYHYLAGDIQNCHLEAKELFDLLPDFGGKEDVYRPFPTVLFTIRLVIKVSSCLESVLAKELKELNECKIALEVERTEEFEQHTTDEIMHGSSGTVILKAPHTTEVSLDRLTPVLSKENSAPQDLSKESVHLTQNQDQEPVFHELKCELDIDKDNSFPPSIHDSSPVLWHSLDIWRTVSRTGIGLADAVDGLLSCTEDFDPEIWLNSMIAILVMSEASKISNTVLATFQTFARQGIIKSVQTGNEMKTSRWVDKHKGSYSLEDNFGVTYSSSYPNENDFVRTPNLLQQLREFLSPQPLRDQSDHKQIPPPTGATQVARGSQTSNLTCLNLESRKKEKKENLARSNKTQTDVDVDRYRSRRVSLSPPTFMEQLKELPSPEPLHDLSSHKQFPSSTGDAQASRVSPTSNLTRLNLESHNKVKSSTLAECKINDDVDGSQTRRTSSTSPRNMEEEINNNVDMNNLSYTSGGSLADVSSLGSVDIGKHHPAPQAQGTSGHEIRPNASRKHRRKRYEKSPPSNSSQSSTDDMPLQDVRHTRTSKRNMRAKDTSKDNLEQSQLNENIEKAYVTRESTISLGAVGGATEETSMLSGQKSITAPPTRADGSKGWSWQLIVTYVQCLGQICLHGNSSVIQRDALIGSSGVALVQLLNFQLSNTEESDNHDWSWRIRHVAVLELVKICSYYRHDALKQGLRNSAWSSLLSHHSLERDRRVLEAYKIARNEMETMDYLFVSNADQPSLLSRISTNLAIIHLPPLTSPVKLPIISPLKKSSPRRQVRHKNEMNKTVPRISIKDEIMLATALDSKSVSYKNRAWKTVQEVVEDQWRKELLEENEEVEKERLTQLERKMTQIAENVNKEPLRQRTL